LRKRRSRPLKKHQPSEKKVLESVLTVCRSVHAIRTSDALVIGSGNGNGECDEREKREDHVEETAT